MDGLEVAETECLKLLSLACHPYLRERLHAILKDITQTKQQELPRCAVGDNAKSPEFIPASHTATASASVSYHTGTSEQTPPTVPSSSTGQIFGSQAALPSLLKSNSLDTSGSPVSLRGILIEQINATPASFTMHDNWANSSTQDTPSVPSASTGPSDRLWPQDHTQQHSEQPNGSSADFACELNQLSINQCMLDNMNQALAAAEMGGSVFGSVDRSNMGLPPSTSQFGQFQGPSLSFPDGWSSNVGQAVPQNQANRQTQWQQRLFDNNSYRIAANTNGFNNRLVHQGVPSHRSNNTAPRGMVNGSNGLMNGSLHGSSGNNFSHRMEAARSNRGYGTSVQDVPHFQNGGNAALNALANGRIHMQNGEGNNYFLGDINQGQLALANHRSKLSLPIHPWGVDLQKGELDSMGMPLFRPLTTYSWEQSDGLVKIYVPLRGVQTNLLRATFTSTSVEVRVVGLQGKNYIYQIKSLYMPISSDGCHVAASKTKKNVLITLQKLSTHAQEAKHWRDLSCI